MHIILILLYILPLIQALTFKEFICQTTNICNRDITVQELCDYDIICLNGIVKQTTTTPAPTTTMNDLQKLNHRLNCTITNDDISFIIQKFYIPPTTQPPTTQPTTTTTTTTMLRGESIQETPSTELSPEIITLIVLGSLLGLALLVGLAILIKKKCT